VIQTIKHAVFVLKVGVNVKTAVHVFYPLMGTKEFVNVKHLLLANYVVILVVKVGVNVKMVVYVLYMTPETTVNVVTGGLDLLVKLQLHVVQTIVMALDVNLIQLEGLVHAKTGG